VIFFDMGPKIEAETTIREIKGSLKRQTEEDKLMHSVMQAEDTKEKGKLIKDAINQGLSSFMSDMIFEHLVKNYSLAKQIYGDTIIKLLSGYNPSYVKRNINIPEFRKELKKNINEKIDQLKAEEILDKDGMINDKGVELAALNLYTEELDKLKAKGLLGERIHKKTSHYGDKEEVTEYKKSRYRDIAIRRTVKSAVKRNHSTIQAEDLKIFQKQSRGHIEILYGLDASGSMRGKKIDMCKRAGVALAFNAIQKKDKVGLIVFGTEVKQIIQPTYDFMMLVREITKVRASRQTNITETIKKSIEVFTNNDASKHLILITDAMPTIGKEPEKEVLEAVSTARNQGIIVDIVGINLDKKAETFAKNVVSISNGKLLICRELENLDSLILQDYYESI